MTTAKKQINNGSSKKVGLKSFLKRSSRKQRDNSKRRNASLNSNGKSSNSKFSRQSTFNKRRSPVVDDLHLARNSKSFDSDNERRKSGKTLTFVNKQMKKKKVNHSKKNVSREELPSSVVEEEHSKNQIKPSVKSEEANSPRKERKERNERKERMAIQHENKNKLGLWGKITNKFQQMVFHCGQQVHNSMMFLCCAR